MNYSPTGSIITFAPGLNGQTCTLSTSSEIIVTKSLTLDASSLPGGLTIDGGTGTNRLFRVNSGQSLTLRGLTLTGGNGTGAANTNNGGAIYNEGTVTLDRCTLSGNSASFGGALFNFGTLTLTQCTLSGNSSSEDGGAILNRFGGTLTLTQCTLSGNAASNDGGALFNLGTLTLTQCTLSGNSSSLDGGAINNKGTLTLTQCTLSGNSSSLDGGAITSYATLTLTKCTLSGNSAAIYGGAIYNYFSLTLIQCTLSGNAARINGGGIYADSATLNLTHSIIAGNTDTDSSSPDIFKNSSGTINLTGTDLLSNLTGSTLTAGPNVIVGDPKLSPLGYFGGPVQTMHPLIGSPAIDSAGTANPGGTDARGFTRFQDGDNLNGNQLDIGAVEAGPLFNVATASDVAGLNLRLNLANFAAGSGVRLGFNPAVFPATITLNGTQLDIPATANGLFIDASNLTGPVTISGNNASRVFNIASGATVAMHSLKIVNGNAPGLLESGGGIRNFGTCTVMSSTLSGNSADDGGGIYNGGTCIVYSSTLSGNSAISGGGGGIFNSGTCTVLSSTFSGNSASLGDGGGIFTFGTCTVMSSTFSGNSAYYLGGGIYNTRTCTVLSSTLSGNSAYYLGGGGILTTAIAATPFYLSASIIAGNTDKGSSPDIFKNPSATINLTGTNLLSNLTGSGLTAGPNVIVADPKLSPLGDYGGPTQTRPPLPGSPAINAAIGSTRLTDQRGFPIVGTADIGAAEYQGTTDLRLFWNTDGDGDGNAFGVEHALGTNASVADRATPAISAPQHSPPWGRPA